MEKIGQYLWNLLIAVDQLGNAILAGDPDETISSRLGKWREGPSGWRRSVAYAVCRLLHILDKSHCERSVEPDEGDRGLL
jgi:hypothetical protein